MNSHRIRFGGLSGALVLLLVLSACGGGAAAKGASGFTSAAVSGTPVPASASANVASVLRTTWQSYARDFIQGDGRVIDHSRQSVSTSEGQSYAMLRAVWMGDRPQFDLVWKWTQSNLQVRSDHLFGYLWGQHSDGTWSIINKDSATDADEDIALALIFAGRTWSDPTYTNQATQIISDIWTHEIAKIKGQPYLTAGNWAPSQTKPGPAIDPSYFAPYEYRLFATLDPHHAWTKVIETSYRLLSQCSQLKLGRSKSVNLPPNWCAVSRSSGKAVADPKISGAEIYGYDAFRTMWRTALDWEWNHEPRARDYLMKSRFLRDAWKRHKKLAAQYHHDGTPLAGAADPTVYGGDIGNFLVTAPSVATTITRTRILSSLRTANGQMFWGNRYSYYEQNWLWFGLALAKGQIPNLARTG
jgi:endoglucanase